MKYSNEEISFYKKVYIASVASGVLPATANRNALEAVLALRTMSFNTKYTVEEIKALKASKSSVVRETNLSIIKDSE